MRTASPTGSSGPVASTDLRVTRPRWWRLASLLQRLLALAVVVGMVWLFVLGILGYLRIDDVIPTPELRGVPVPSLLLLGGILAGLVLAFLARVANGVGAGDARAPPHARSVARSRMHRSSWSVPSRRSSMPTSASAPYSRPPVRRRPAGGSGAGGAAKTVNKLLDPPDQKQAE